MRQILTREWQRFKGRCIYSCAGLPIAPGLRVLIFRLGALVLAAECFNTAIERVVNHLSPGQHPLAKAAKDAGSAGVALTAGAAGVAWVFALWGLL